MANDLTNNPIYVDTAGEIYAADQPTSIKKIVFVGASDDDDLLIEDAGSNHVLLKTRVSTIATSGNMQQFDFAGGLHCPNGVKVTTIDGTAHCLIYT